MVVNLSSHSLDSFSAVLLLLFDCFVCAAAIRRHTHIPTFFFSSFQTCYTEICVPVYFLMSLDKLLFLMLHIAGTKGTVEYAQIYEPF